MTPLLASSASEPAVLLAPEQPALNAGGGPLRTASLLDYLRTRYSVEVVVLSVRPHSRRGASRLWRNSIRLARGTPPLFDRFSGYESQVVATMRSDRYRLGVVEHFWCASYATLLRGRCDRLVLDLHNIESELARTHARAARWPTSWASACFARAYADLEREWLRKFDVILVASEEDRNRIKHPDVRVFPNALPEVPQPEVAEANAIAFSGNLEYHPNVEAVRWFRAQVWPRVRETGVEWRLIGRNPAAIAHLIAGDPQIRVIGPVDDAIAALAEAKVCIVSLRSGSGTRFKILEAWAAGRAVVSTTIGAEGLGARDGEHLLIADDPRAFADAVSRLLVDAPLRRRLGDAGRALYQERFTWPAAQRRLEVGGCSL
jgi:glycosyltransferase involved in cell wall biosynthesis